MSKSKEQQLWEACTSGDLDLVKRLANDPAVNVNWEDPELSRTPFYRACFYGRLSVVEFLLTFTKVDVNKLQGQGCTPFYIACQNGHKEVVSLLLAEMRIDINKPNNEQLTPLWMASQKGHLRVVQLLLASGKEIDTKAKSKAGIAPWNNKTAAEIGQFQATRATLYQGESEEDLLKGKQNGPLIATLIDSYEQNPQHVRTQLRKQLGLEGQFLLSPLLLHLSSHLYCPQSLHSHPSKSLLLPL